MKMIQTTTDLKIACNEAKHVQVFFILNFQTTYFFSVLVKCEFAPYLGFSYSEKLYCTSIAKFRMQFKKIVKSHF